MVVGVREFRKDVVESRWEAGESSHERQREETESEGESEKAGSTDGK